MAARRLAAFALIALAAIARAEAPAQPSDRPIAEPSAGYVTSAACQSCHPDEYASWRASYHRRMTQVAAPGVIEAPFDGRTLDALGTRARVTRRGNAHWIDVAARGAEGQLEKSSGAVQLVTGSHHMQIYWLASGRGRMLRAAPFVWLREPGRWVPRPSVFLQPPVAQIESEEARWNTTCLVCHTTDPRPGIPNRRRLDEVDTRVSEFGIACEECHGPGAAHVAQNRDPLRRYGQHLSEANSSAIVQPAKLGAQRSAEVCGQCHAIAYFRTRNDESEFLKRGFSYQPGQELERERTLVQRHVPEQAPAIARAFAGDWDNSFWSDGVVRVSGREYNALAESPCFRGGQLSCLSCHELHPSAGSAASLAAWADDQLRPGMRGDAACVQCHPAPELASALHTHHAPESEGSRCQNCHTPHTTYGLLKAIRSHAVESPSVAHALATGRPNGCALCHLDRTLEWTGNWLETWYGQARPELPATARELAEGPRLALTGDAGQRALVAWHLGWEPARAASDVAWMPPYLLQLMADEPYDAVRFIAERSLRRLPGYERLAYDFLAGPELRKRAVLAGIRRFGSLLAKHPATARPETLVAERHFDAASFERYAAQRDDRAIALRE
jgi:hypothetical protein